MPSFQDKKEIRTHSVSGMWGLGTPEDLHFYLQNYLKLKTT